MGQAERTQKSSTEWLITLFHEHFHQLQYSQPTYLAGVKALNLARGDNTGMWMLNFAFPYDKQEVQQQFSTLSKLLVEAIEARDEKDRSLKLTAYLAARRQFQEMLNPDDYKYFSFQFWQEGIARYTEYRVAEFAAANYRPGKAFRALKDFIPFAKIAEATNDGIVKELVTQQLAQSKREVVYPFGAAEGLLLDRVNPVWRSRYFVDKFDLRSYYDTAARAPSNRSDATAAPNLDYPLVSPRFPMNSFTILSESSCRCWQYSTTLKPTTFIDLAKA